MIFSIYHVNNWLPNMKDTINTKQNRLYIKLIFVLVAALLFCTPLKAQKTVPGQAVTSPYDINKCLARAEELFALNQFPAALIFYYEALTLTEHPGIIAKIHFRIGECLESIRRFDFATYRYKLALSTGALPDLLSSRAIMKLEHLPEMAQKEEATRLYKSAMQNYKTRNIRLAIDDYLASIRLLPELLNRSDRGLIEDAVKYLTYLSEGKEREPERLLKLATFLELHGSIEKAVETLQQLIIIYPGTDQAREAEMKLESFAGTYISHTKPEEPYDPFKDFAEPDSPIVFENEYSLTKTTTISKELRGVAFTITTFNDAHQLPSDRYEKIEVILGVGAEQKEIIFSAAQGINMDKVVFDVPGGLRYIVSFNDVSTTSASIRDSYTGDIKIIKVFNYIRLGMKIERLYTD